jgi:putative endopeptidase
LDGTYRRAIRPNPFALLPCSRYTSSFVPEIYMRKLLTVVFATCLSAAAQTAPAKSAPPVAPDKPLQALPYSPSLDLTDMDKSVDPCVDFYTYSCGGWQKKNPIPADQSSWSVYGKLYDDNQQFLWGILDDLSKQTTGRTPARR